MSLDVKVPASGESITSANVARWHKKNGDPVKKGEILVTLETDKVSNELEAASDGTLESPPLRQPPLLPPRHPLLLPHPLRVRSSS